VLARTYVNALKKFAQTCCSYLAI